MDGRACAQNVLQHDTQRFLHMEKTRLLAAYTHGPKNFANEFYHAHHPVTVRYLLCYC